MKIDEAIEILKEIYPSKSQIGKGEYDHVAEALDMAIEALEWQKRFDDEMYISKDYHDKVYAELQKRYFDLLVPERTRWITVSERLPIENGKYLIYVSEHTTEDGVQREEITSAIWSDKKWYYGHSWVPRQKPVTHWMPLPDDCPLQEVE